MVELVKERAARGEEGEGGAPEGEGYLVASLPAHGNALAFASLLDYNVQAGNQLANGIAPPRPRLPIL